MLGLRRDEGVDLADFEEHHGIDLRARNESRIARGIDAGHMKLEASRLSLTFAGLAIADGIVAELELR